MYMLILACFQCVIASVRESALGVCIRLDYFSIFLGVLQCSVHVVILSPCWV